MFGHRLLSSSRKLPTLIPFSKLTCRFSEASNPLSWPTPCKHHYCACQQKVSPSSRLILLSTQPFVQYAKDGTTEVISPPGEKVAGFEGAGMGKRVDLGKGLEVNEVVRIIKEHLSLEYGMLQSWHI
jgi:hypothetical protein